MTGDLNQSPHWTDAAVAAMQFVSQVEAEWQDAPKERLSGWHEGLSRGLANIQAAHARTEAFAAAGALNPTQPAVLSAYLRVAPTVIARLETLIANVASRIDAPSSAG